MNNLVIKGKNEHTKFPAVDSANFPRLALYDGTYIPLVEDDGSDGTTLKIRIGDKVYRIKTDTLWEAYFDVNFTDLSSYIKQFVVIIDDSYNVVFYDPTNGKSFFTSTYLKRVGNEKQLYATTDEYAHGPWNAEYSAAQTPYAKISNGNKVGNGSNYYTQMVVSTNLSAPNLPFTEVCFAWMYGPTQTYSQACIFNPNKQKNYPWQSYQTYGCCGEYINTLFDYSFSHTFNLKNTVLFAGKVRIIKLNDSGSTSITDLNANIPISEILSTSHVAFAIPDKSFTNYPFESVICDNRNSSQVVFDMYDILKTGTMVPDTLRTYKAIGDYLDITSDFFDVPYSCTLTAKKDCTLLAIKQDPTDYLVKITRQNLIAGDTFNYSGYSVTGVYTLLAFQDETALPDEIGWSHVYNRDNWGYFYNSITKQAERDTGTYLRRNGYATEKYTNFDGDLIIQNAYGCVQKVDGQDSWSQTFFQGFAMVFLATDSTLTVNTIVGDDIMLFDQEDTLLDDQIADSEGVVTFTIPTTKIGRSYRVQSATTGQSIDITATGNESVNLTPSAQLPDFEVMWAYQYGNNAGMISGNPDTGLAYNYKPYSEFKGKMLKQLCSTTYRAPFSIIGQRGTQYNVYQIDVEIVNGEGLRMCWACINPGHTTILFDGDVRTLITAKTYFHRDASPFSNTETIYYDANTNISYFSPSATLLTPVIKEPPCVKVWDSSTGLYDQALSAARAYFDSKSYHLPVLRCDTSRTGTGDPTDYAKNQAWTILQNNPTDDVVIVVETDPFYASLRGASYITVTVCISGNKPTGLTLKNFNGDTSIPSLSYDSTYKVTKLQGTLWANTTTPTLDDFIQSGKVLKNIGGDISSSTIMASNFFDGMSSYAVTTELAEDVRCGDVGILPEYLSYTQNSLVSQTFPARDVAYDRLIIAKKDVKYLGCEIAFVWYTGGPTEACIVKQNNEHVPHATTMTGDFITIANSQSITIAAFAGKIKYKLNNNQMITMDASSGLSLTMSTDLQGISVFFCYPDMPYRYVIYQGISAGNVTDNRYTFKGAPKGAVTIAYLNLTGDSWNYGVAYDDSISATVTYDLDYKNTNGVWVNTRSNVSANHQSSNTYKIIGKTGAFSSTYSQNDAQFTGTSFEDVAQKVRQYFDTH